MHLIVGLGNPGDEYLLNRHNAGFIVLDEIRAKYHLVKAKDKYNSNFYKGSIAGHDVMAIKPLTFMNNSGKAVAAFASFFKIDIEKVIVIYDELDLGFGKVKIKIGGGAAGHNGIRSINSFIPNSYTKIRVGIGHPGERELVSRHVLSNFTKLELGELDAVSFRVANLFEYIIQGSYDVFSSKVNLNEK